MATQDSLTQLTDLTGLINGHLDTIERERDKVKKTKEMLDGILSNDPVYQEKDTKAKEAAKEKANIKAQVLKQPQAYDLNFKIKESRAELKQLETELSAFLDQYQKMTGSSSFEDSHGETHQIVYIAKLVGRTHLNDDQP